VPTTLPATARNPLRTYQFRIGVLPPGTTGAAAPYVAGVRRVSGLSVTVTAAETWEGGNPLHRYANPDRATWEPITLEQGLALDDTLERWAAAVVQFLRTGTVTRGQPVKRNVLIDVWDPDLHGRVAPVPNPGVEQRIRRYLVFNAWISRLRALPQLDAMSDEVALLGVDLTHEGWRTDPPPSGGTPVGTETAGA
jgi:phage tail-like protein